MIDQMTHLSMSHYCITNNKHKLELITRETMENEELDYLVNQKAAKLVSQCHLKEKEKFEKLQKKLEEANCINEVINPFKVDIHAND